VTTPSRSLFPKNLKLTEAYRTKPRTPMVKYIAFMACLMNSRSDIEIQFTLISKKLSQLPVTPWNFSCK
jgi:hypothetical protein